MLNSKEVRAFNERIRYIKEGKQRKGETTKGVEREEFEFLKDTKEYQNLVKNAKRFREIAGIEDREGRDWYLPYTKKELKNFYDNASANDVKAFEKLFNKYSKMSMFTSKGIKQNMKEFKEIKRKFKEYIGTEYTGEFVNAQYTKWFVFNSLVEKGFDSEQAYELVDGDSRGKESQSAELYYLDLLDYTQTHKNLTKAELLEQMNDLHLEYLQLK